MEEKYPYYKTAGPTWKQSVRHHLSLNRLFEKQPRPATDPGFGSYWGVNLEAPPGTKRPRKRGRTGRDGDSTEQETQPIKKRGRPKKKSGKGSDQGSDDDSDEEEAEFESEDESVYPYEHARRIAEVKRGSASRRLQQQQESAQLSSQALEEQATMRQQCSDAVSTSLKLSGQLADAQAEITSIRATLRHTEAELGEERRRRLDAERQAHYEVRLRKAQEETLQAIRGSLFQSSNCGPSSS